MITTVAVYPGGTVPLSGRAVDLIVSPDGVALAVVDSEDQSGGQFRVDHLGGAWPGARLIRAVWCVGPVGLFEVPR